MFDAFSGTKGNAVRVWVKGDVGIFTARNVPPGNHVVRMKDLPRECQVEGAAEQTVRVSPGRSIAVRFVITCT